MGADKAGSKSGGIFHLFDWKRKSRKKLFSNSPEGAKLEKKIDESLPSTRLRLGEDEEEITIASIKCTSEYSCASSATDEDGLGTKVPNVVARLMGLDSMPVPAFSEPYSTPFCDERSFGDNQRNLEYCIKQQFDHVPQRAEGYMRRPELRSQKMPSSPIERFQTEVLPPRSAKSLAISHHRLLSPIKNPGFTSERNPDQIMEYAAKMYEPRHEASSRGKICSFGPPRVPFRACELKDGGMTSQKVSQIMQLTRVPIESTNVRFSRGQQLNSRWNHVDDIVLPSADHYESNSTFSRGKGKSVSLAVQAKANVQKREGVCLPGRSNGLQHEHEECRLNQPFRSQASPQRNKLQKKSSASNTSSVLRQNNQKQNCITNRSKLATNKSVSIQQGRKSQSGDASLGKSRTVSKISKVNSRREIAESSGEFERDGVFSNNMDFPQKKRMIERNSGGRIGFVSESNGTRLEKIVQPNVLVDEHTRWTKDNNDTSDVVSFTFTSPLIKPTGGSIFSEKWDAANKYRSNAAPYQTACGLKGGNKSTVKNSNYANGDDLSQLLEQKLKELTFRSEPSLNFISSDKFIPSTCTAQELQSPCDRWDVQREESAGSFSEENSVSCPDSCLSSIKGQVFWDCNLQALERGELSVTSDARKERQEHEDLSPLSVLEPIFSAESCCSSESYGSSSDGCKNSSSLLVDISSVDNCRSVSERHEMDRNPLDTCSLSTLLEEPSDELGFIDAVLSDVDADSLCLVSANNASPRLNALLGRKLKSWKGRQEQGDAAECGGDRSLLLDCVSECLDLKRSIYFQAGCKEWAKGVKAVDNGLATEINKEIDGWRMMGDKTVDELVDKDMSSQLGSWVDFRIEAYELATDLEKEILDSLIGEAISDARIGL